MIILPKRMFSPNFKSMANSFDDDENVESKVEAAKVIMIKLITNNSITPNDLLTITAASFPCRPCFYAKNSDNAK
jgi:hypothetical protein